jgi:hypothetical protein
MALHQMLQPELEQAEAWVQRFKLTKAPADINNAWYGCQHRLHFRLRPSPFLVIGPTITMFTSASAGCYPS